MLILKLFRKLLSYRSLPLITTTLSVRGAQRTRYGPLLWWWTIAVLPGPWASGARPTTLTSMCTHHTHTRTTHITTHYQATQFNSQWIFSPFNIYQYAHTPYKSPDAVPHTKANILTNTHTGYKQTSFQDREEYLVIPNVVSHGDHTWHPELCHALQQSLEPE